jgi:hypothetical protein
MARPARASLLARSARRAGSYAPSSRDCSGGSPSDAGLASGKGTAGGESQAPAVLGEEWSAATHPQTRQCMQGDGVSPVLGKDRR